MQIAIGSIVAPAVLVALVLLVIVPWWLALLVGLAAAVGAWWWARSAEARVLDALEARPIDSTRHARLVNLAEGLALQAGVTVPELRIVESSASNAMVIGRDEARAALVVTSGLFDRLDRVELEAVIAQLLAQLRAADTAPRTAAFAHLAPLARLSGGLYGSIIDRVVDPDRRFRNDAVGVSITRFPPGLVAAYEKLDGGATMESCPAAAEHLWMVAPRVGSSTHPSTSIRIAALREL